MQQDSKNTLVKNRIVTFIENDKGVSWHKGKRITGHIADICPCCSKTVMILPWNSGHERLMKVSDLTLTNKIRERSPYE